MVIWELKKCPRCGGDMFIDRDIYGWYEKCLQCAYSCELRKLKKLSRDPLQIDKMLGEMLAHKSGGKVRQS